MSIDGKAIESLLRAESYVVYGVIRLVYIELMNDDGEKVMLVLHI